MTNVVRQVHNVLSILVDVLTDIGHAQQLLDRRPHLQHQGETVLCHCTHLPETCSHSGCL